MCSRKISRISARLRWIAGTTMWLGQVVAELDDQLGEVGLDRVDAGRGERLVEPDLVGRHRLHLDDLAGAVSLGRGRRRCGWPRPRRAAQWTWPPAAVTLVSNSSRSSSRRPSTSSLIAGRLPRGSCPKSGSSATTTVALGADRRRGSSQVRPQLAVRDAGTGGLGERWRVLEAPTHRPAPGACGVSAGEARISARCMTRSPEPSRDEPPPRWARQELSAAHSTSAPVSCTEASLSASIAIDVSAFLMANVPPKPQHDSASGSSTSSRPRTARRSRSGRVAEAQHAQRVAGRVVGDPVGERGADIGHAEHVDEQLRQLVDPRGELTCSVRERSISGVLPEARVGLDDGPGTRRRGNDDRLERREDLDEAPRRARRPLAGSPQLRCICPQQVCASGNTTSWPSRSSTVTTARPVSG